MKDTIYRADAIDAVCGVVIDEFDVSPTLGYEVAEKALSALPSAEQVTGKLKNPCDSLLKSDSDECKEQKSKLDLISRADAIEAVRLETGKLGRWLLGRGDILDIISALPSAETTGALDDAITKYVADGLMEFPSAEADWKRRVMMYLADLQLSCDTHTEIGKAKWEALEMAFRGVADIPSAEAVQGWIPCSERLPSAEDCPMDCMVTRRSEYVGNYTDMAIAEADGTWTHEDWKAITLNGEATCISTRDADIIAWMPLPKPYKGGEDE